MFTYLRQRSANKQKARQFYEKAVAQARQPAFYADYAVPDTVDGRFEMIALHCYILMRRLQAAGEKKLSQALFDCFFKTMDRSLREMGVGDLGVPKHMKRMMQGFNGRANHYELALQNNNSDELQKALIKNVYGTVEAPSVKILKAMEEYVIKSATMITTDPVFSPLKINDEELKIA